MKQIEKGISTAARITVIALSVAALAAAQDRARQAADVERHVFNFRALKGIPVDDLMKSIGLISAALSFDCSDCHEGAGTDKVDRPLTHRAK